MAIKKKKGWSFIQTDQAISSHVIYLFAVLCACGPLFLAVTLTKAQYGHDDYWLGLGLCTCMFWLRT